MTDLQCLKLSSEREKHGHLRTNTEGLGQEDPLEKEMATHSSTLAWRIPWMEDKESDMTERLI